jgi:hypothetical protein
LPGITILGDYDRSYKMTITFIKVNPVWFERANEIFLSTKPQNAKVDEVSELFWITEKDFVHLMYHRLQENVMWKKLSTFFANNYSRDISKALREHKS